MSHLSQWRCSNRMYISSSKPKNTSRFAISLPLKDQITWHKVRGTIICLHLCLSCMNTSAVNHQGTVPRQVTLTYCSISAKADEQSEVSIASLCCVAETGQKEAHTQGEDVGATWPGHVVLLDGLIERGLAQQQEAEANPHDQQPGHGKAESAGRHTTEQHNWVTNVSLHIYSRQHS